MTVTAARTAQNKRFNERIQNNASAPAFCILVHFFAVPYKTTASNFGEHESPVTLEKLKDFKILHKAKYFKIPRFLFPW